MAAAVCCAAAGGADCEYCEYCEYYVFIWGAVCAALPNGNSAPEPKQTAASNPSGYTVTHPYPSHKSHKSHKSHASVTPPQTAYPRCYQVATHYPAVTLRAALPCGKFLHSNSVWQRRFAVLRRAAQLVRIGTDVYGWVRRKGAPYALHYPCGNSARCNTHR